MSNEKLKNRLRKEKPEVAKFREEAAALRARILTRMQSVAAGLDPLPSAIAQRRLQAHASFQFFAETYFSHYTTCEWASLHLYLFERFQQALDNGVGDHDVTAAPRGHAKSTLISLIGILWAVVTKRKRYPILVMDALDQAVPMLEAIKVELEENQKLAMDFPEVCGQGRVWQSTVIVTANNAKIEVFGSKKKIRGRRHGQQRVDLAILDDVENDENVTNAAQRDKLQAFINKSVLSLGPADDSMDVFMIGTILHYDSVLSRFLKNKFWHGKKFQAIERWPDDMDSWEKWESIVNCDGEEAGLAFYQRNKQRMDAGARLCWPGGTTLYTLMRKRARDGHDAFDSEQQNDPISGEHAIFASCIHFWVDRLNEWVHYAALDPSLGKTSTSDPSALLVGGFHREKRVLHVLEASIKRRKPLQIIEDAITYQKEYKCLMWAIEAVQFQAFFADVLFDMALAQNTPLPVKQVIPREDKHLRIASLQPFFARQKILLHASQKELISHLRHFPLADHDDGPDALEMLWQLCFTHAGKRSSKPVGATAKGQRAAGRMIEGY